jgi:hypothetical protein
MFIMAYCPQCFVEYVEGTIQCEDCGTTLLLGTPPEAPHGVDLPDEKDVKLVSVRSFSGATAQLDADVARNILQVQRISCALSGEGAADPFPVTEVHLLVREEDAVRAEHFLKDYLDSGSAAITEEPEKDEQA